MGLCGVSLKMRCEGQGPVWWGAGLAVVVWVGPQIVIGFLEGSSRSGEDYTASIASAPGLYATMLVLAMATGSAYYAFPWRASWAETGPEFGSRPRLWGFGWCSKPL